MNAHNVMIGAAVFTLLLAPAGRLHAAVACGDSITTSVKLTADLSCPDSDGLHVDADGVTLDLGGHVLDGMGSARGHTGVLVDGHANVRIKNGTVSNFFFGGRFANAAGSSITKVVARFDSTGIGIEGTGVTASKNVCVNDGYAVAISGNANTVDKNTVAAIANQALFVVGDDNVLTGNNVSVGFVGVSILGKGNRVGKNVVQGSAANGIECFGTATIAGNTTVGNAADGIHVEIGPGSTITKNKALANRANGISASADSDGSAIIGNTATGNRADGIDVESAGAATRVGKNAARLNGVDGIFAQPGVSDAGGNKAKDNGAADCAAGVIACR